MNEREAEQAMKEERIENYTLEDGKVVVKRTMELDVRGRDAAKFYREEVEGNSSPFPHCSGPFLNSDSPLAMQRWS